MMKTRILDNKPLLIKMLLASLVLAGGAVWLMGHSIAEEAVAAPAATGRPALTVRTVVLKEGKWSETLSANGSILPWQEAIIGSQLQGVRIAEVKVSIGDSVKRGEVLATLDNAIRRDGDDTPQGKILAPDDGIISSTSANAGSMPQAGVELFRLIRKGRLEWRAELTADELMLLRRGMKVHVLLVGGRTLSGTVRAISPSVDPHTRYGYALVALNDSSGVIAGAFARGTFDVSSARKVRWLPAGAVLQRGSQSYVLAVDAESRVHERVVQIGQRNGARIEITRGLQAGEPVVESGGAFLTEGDLVLVVKE
ncbi:MAG: efflux RND transporter periplasmic adaptor subunit [Sideroxydans sp.]|nr:efflux RND transporter periplasmic adaptor subunit [Sideroxydans sp.]